MKMILRPALALVILWAWGAGGWLCLVFTVAGAAVGYLLAAWSDVELHE